MSKRVVIPRFSESNEEKYFSPRFVTIRKGESIEWVNFDIKSHTLFFKIVKPLSDYSIPPLGPIDPDTLVERIFDYDVIRIDYTCISHNLENGSIVFLPDRELNNAEYQRYLQDVFDLPPPIILHHSRFSNIANVI